MPAFVLDNGSDFDLEIGRIGTHPPKQNILNLLPYFDLLGNIIAYYPPAAIQIGPNHYPLCLNEDLGRIPGHITPVKRYPENFRYKDAIFDLKQSLEEGNQEFEAMDVFVSESVAKTQRNKEFILSLELTKGFPTPAPGTEIDNILQFREEFSSERKAFWKAMQAIVDEYDFSDPINHARNVRNSVRKDLEDFERISSQTWLKRTIDRSVFNFIPTNASAKCILTALAAAQIIEPSVVGMDLEEAKKYLSESSWLGVTLGVIAIFEIKISLVHSKPPINQRAYALSYLQKISTI